MNDPTYAVILALAVVLGAVLAIAAMVLGLWFAGRLTGVMGKPLLVVGPDGDAQGVGIYEQPDDIEAGPELVPWEGDEPPREGVDPGADPDAWTEAPQ